MKSHIWRLIFNFFFPLLLALVVGVEGLKLSIALANMPSDNAVVLAGCILLITIGVAATMVAIAFERLTILNERERKE